MWKSPRHSDTFDAMEVARRGGTGAFWMKLLYPLFGVAIALLTAHYPTWNFDTIGYAGVAQRWLGASDAEAHAKTYQDVKAAAPPRDYKALAASSNYRKRVARHAPIFAAQLPMYSNKPLYAALVTACVAGGVNSIAAPFYVSAAAYGVLAALLAWLLVSLVGRRAGWAMAVALALLPPLLELGRLATPDAVCAAFSLSGGWLLFRGQRTKTAVTLLILATLTRPDHVFFSAGLAGWLAYAQPARRQYAIILAALSVLAMLVGTRVTGALSWSALFNHGFIRVMASAEEMAAATVSLQQYCVALGRGLRADVVLHPSICTAFVCCTVGSWFIQRTLRSHPGANARHANLLFQAMCWATVLLQFLVFPILADRFFAARYLLVVAASLTMLADLARRHSAEEETAAI